MIVELLLEGFVKDIDLALVIDKDEGVTVGIYEVVCNS